MNLTHIIPLSIRLKISLFIRKFKLKKRLKMLRKSRENKDECIFLVLNIPSHGNMGDQLIAYAEKQLLESSFQNVQIEYFTTGELECGVKLMKNIVQQQDVLFITGGGFLGSIYPDEEKRFQDVMRFFPNNKIILFPQTFHYDGSSSLLEETIELQKHCSQLVVSTREKSSYDFIKSHFDKAIVLLLPDVATTLNFSHYASKREGICICSRDDREKAPQSCLLFEETLKWAKENNVPISHFDTQVQYPVSATMRANEIDKLIKIVSSSRMVVTDRLHGMIYSIITGTPVFAADNTTHKISGSIDSWFKDLNYVKIYSDGDSIIDDIECLLKMGSQKYENGKYVEKIKKLFVYV